MVAGPSTSVPRHLIRGALGLLACVAAFAGAGLIGPASLLLLPVAAVAWRGCPTCWLVGLMQTRADCACARLGDQPAGHAA